MEERGVALRRTGSTFKACCPFILKRPHPSTSIHSVVSGIVLAAELAAMPFVF